MECDELRNKLYKQNEILAGATYTNGITRACHHKACDGNVITGLELILINLIPKFDGFDLATEDT